MMAPGRNELDPDDEYQPSETIVLDDESVMDTGEFRKLVALDPRLLDESGPFEQDD